MKLSLEQFRERLVDYLYGMLDGDDLRDFEACLQESEVCRRELSTMRATLQTARKELATVADEPPPRVRTAVLAAASEEARELAAAHRERKSQRPSRRPSLHPASARPRAVTEKSAGLWSWLRTPWLVPTLGVAAAVAVVVLNKDVESPDLHREAAQAPAEAPTESEPGTPPPAPIAPPAPAAPAAPRAEGTAPRDEADSLRAESASGGARHRAPAKGYAEPPAAWRELRGDEAKKEQTEEMAAAPERSSADDLAGALEQEAAPAADTLAANPRAGLGQAEGRASRHSAASAAPGRVQAKAAKPESSESADKSVVADGASAEQTVLVKLAASHQKAGRWALASETYRELLSRYPADPQASTWQKQRALADRALQTLTDAGR